MIRPINVTISAPVAGGKSILCKIIRDALTAHGLNFVIDDADGDTANKPILPEQIEYLKTKTINLSMQQMSRQALSEIESENSYSRNLNSSVLKEV